MGCHGPDHVIRIADFSLVCIAKAVNACNCIIQTVHMTFSKIQGTAVQDVDLTAVEHFNPKKIPGGITNIQKIDGVAGAGNSGTVLCGAQNLQTAGSGFCCHFPDGAKGMTTHNRVGMQICNQWLHIDHPFPFFIVYHKMVILCKQYVFVASQEKNCYDIAK